MRNLNILCHLNVVVIVYIYHTQLGYSSKSNYAVELLFLIQQLHCERSANLTSVGNSFRTNYFDVFCRSASVKHSRLTFWSMIGWVSAYHQKRSSVITRRSGLVKSGVSSRYTRYQIPAKFGID